MIKKAKLRFLSFLMAIMMVVTMFPVTTNATETENVYISVSYDGQYIDDKNGNPMAYIPVSFESLEKVDLDEYGLSDYIYDENGDGTPEITALHLVIYAHENIYGGEWSDVTFTGAPGSSYFQGGIFGFDENLNYYLNGQYPLAGAGWGATSDQIVLKSGDFIDLAAFSSWDFYQDSAYGFHFFADENGKITHNYSVKAEETLNLKLIKGTKDYEYNSVFYDVADYEVFYGSSLYDAIGSVTTDSNACAEISFPSDGTFYLWVDGGYGNAKEGELRKLRIRFDRRGAPIVFVVAHCHTHEAHVVHPFHNDVALREIRFRAPLPHIPSGQDNRILARRLRGAQVRAHFVHADIRVSIVELAVHIVNGVQIQRHRQGDIAIITAIVVVFIRVRTFAFGGFGFFGCFAHFGCFAR